MSFDETLNALTFVRLGSNNLKDDNSSLYKIDYFKIHENFSLDDTSTLLNDIALVRVSEPILFNDNVNKIAFETETPENDYTSAILSGWGLTKCHDNSEVSFFFTENDT